ncbi:MAG: hypothetical protein ACOH2F_01460 [Cellulomonas sp.]
MTAPRLQLTRAQRWLLALAALSYAVGYPLGIALEWVIGWVFVSLGGVFLLALGVVTVRQMNRADAP